MGFIRLLTQDFSIHFKCRSHLIELYESKWSSILNALILFSFEYLIPYKHNHLLGLMLGNSYLK